MLFEAGVLKILQYSQENTCVGVLFNVKKRLQHMFPVNIAKFSKTAFLIKHLRWLLLMKVIFNSFQPNVAFHIKKPVILFSYRNQSFNLLLKISFLTISGEL